MTEDSSIPEGCKYFTADMIKPEFQPRNGEESATIYLGTTPARTIVILGHPWYGDVFQPVPSMRAVAIHGGGHSADKLEHFRRSFPEVSVDRIYEGVGKTSCQNLVLSRKTGDHYSCLDNLLAQELVEE